LRQLKKSCPLAVTAYLFLYSLSCSPSHAEVIVHDLVVRANEEVMLKAETTGRFFRKGGEQVTFLVEGKTVGKTLSGGDGFAYQSFVTRKTGLLKITARSAHEEGSGLLLSLKRGGGIVFVDVEGTLLKGRFSDEPREGSRNAVAVISRKLPVVYLRTGLLSTSVLKAWLKDHHFPELPVVPWDQGRVFDMISEKGFTIRALVAGQDVIESSNKYKPTAFSFEETEDSEEVKDWEEIRKKLR